MDPEGFWSMATSIFIALIVTMSVIVLMYMCLHCKSERLETDSTASMQLAIFSGITTALDLFSTFFFWYLFGMCGYIFVFYKLQERVFCMLPPIDSYLENYSQYEGMLIAVTVCKFLSMFYKIVFEQSALDIFLIDWESPRMYQYGRHQPK